MSELRRRRTGKSSSDSKDDTKPLVAVGVSPEAEDCEPAWYRREISNPVRMLEEITIQFDTPKLGVRVKPGDGNRGLFVAAVTEAAPPIAKERLVAGYQIVRVNEHRNLHQSDFDETVKLFASLTLPIYVTFKPPKFVDRAQLLESKAGDSANNIRRGAHGHFHGHSHRHGNEEDDDSCSIGLALVGYALLVMFLTYIALFGVPFATYLNPKHLWSLSTAAFTRGNAMDQMAEQLHDTGKMADDNSANDKLNAILRNSQIGAESNSMPSFGVFEVASNLMDGFQTGMRRIVRMITGRSWKSPREKNRERRAKRQLERQRSREQSKSVRKKQERRKEYRTAQAKGSHTGGKAKAPVDLKKRLKDALKVDIAGDFKRSFDSDRKRKKD